MIDPVAAAVLDRLHAEARGDWRTFARVAPKAVLGMLGGRSMLEALTPADLASAYIPVGRAEGEFLHLLVRATGARTIVEFGASFGVSAIWLGTAARATGGHVTTTEIEPGKCAATRHNVAEAGLAGVVTLLEGDALDTLAALPGPVDLLFLDGWKDLYLPVLDLLRDRLADRAVVVADNVNLADCRPYVDAVLADAGFVSTRPFGARMLVSVRAQAAGA